MSPYLSVRVHSIVVHTGGVASSILAAPTSSLTVIFTNSPGVAPRAYLGPFVHRHRLHPRNNQMDAEEGNQISHPGVDDDRHI